MQTIDIEEYIKQSQQLEIAYNYYRIFPGVMVSLFDGHLTISKAEKELTLSMDAWCDWQTDPMSGSVQEVFAEFSYEDQEFILTGMLAQDWHDLLERNE
tara:strand:- start:12353 stop:12649 length:297 start_codon:yes stop_codon:yes gene_type:complete